MRCMRYMSSMCVLAPMNIVTFVTVGNGSLHFGSLNRVKREGTRVLFPLLPGYDCGFPNSSQLDEQIAAFIKVFIQFKREVRRYMPDTEWRGIQEQTRVRAAPPNISIENEELTRQ
jgi:hypothetical protein